MRLNDDPWYKVLLIAILWAVAWVGGAVGGIYLIFYGMIYHIEITSVIFISLILIATIIGRYLHLRGKW